MSHLRLGGSRQRDEWSGMLVYSPLLASKSESVTF